MSKKFETPPDTETKIFSDDSAKISLEDLQNELLPFGLKVVQDSFKQKIKIEPMKEDLAKIEIEKFRIELAKLGLKIIDEIKAKRVSKPEDTYNSLINIFNAIKEN